MTELKNFSSPLQDYTQSQRFDLTLSRIEKCLENIGNPHLKMPPTLHVAGTNGKCSTITFMKSILESEGYRVHIYTSPHLVRITERIKLAGIEISDSYFETLHRRLEPYAKKYSLSWFEFLTLIAFSAFHEIPADIVLLETGLGGEFDATNVIPRPLATVITPISFDHMEYLGSSLSEIAKAKAGIMKENIPTFSAYQEEESINILMKKSKEMNSKIYFENNDWSFKKARYEWELFLNEQSYKLPLPENLKGSHQLQNAALAIATLKTLNLVRSKNSFVKGVKEAFVPGRLMCIKNSNHINIWYDGGHNPASAAALASYFKDKENLYVIFGMLKNKNPLSFIETLKPVAKQFIFIPILNSPSSFKPHELNQYDSAGWMANSIKSAIAMISPPANILICGSFYLASELFTLFEVQT